MAEPRTYPQGIPCWVDIETDDIESITDFYGELFGWTFTEATPPQAEFHYLIAQLDGQDVAGVGGPVPTGDSSPAGTPTSLCTMPKRPQSGSRRPAVGSCANRPMAAPVAAP